MSERRMRKLTDQASYKNGVSQNEPIVIKEQNKGRFHIIEKAIQSASNVIRTKGQLVQNLNESSKIESSNQSIADED